MKKIISLISASLFSLMMFAQTSTQHIILVTPADAQQTRVKLRELYGSSLKMQLQSTGEMVLIHEASLSEVRKKVQASLPGATLREVSSEEFEKLKGNQFKK